VLFDNNLNSSFTSEDDLSHIRSFSFSDENTNENIDNVYENNTSDIPITAPSSVIGFDSPSSDISISVNN
jgi:hypothetical protein